MTADFNGWSDAAEDEREECERWEHRDSRVVESLERIRRGAERIANSLRLLNV